MKLIEKYVTKKVKIDRSCFLEETGLKDNLLLKTLEESVVKIIKSKYLYSKNPLSTHSYVRYYKDKLEGIEVNIKIFTSKGFVNVLSYKYNLKDNKEEVITILSNSVDGTLLFNKDEVDFIEVMRNLQEFKNLISKNKNSFIEKIEKELIEIYELEKKILNIIKLNFDEGFLEEIKTDISKRILQSRPSVNEGNKNLSNYKEFLILPSSNYEFNDGIPDTRIENSFILTICLRKEISYGVDDMTIPLYMFSISTFSDKLIKSEQLVIKNLKLFKDNSIKKWLNGDLKDKLLKKINIEKLLMEI